MLGQIQIADNKKIRVKITYLSKTHCNVTHGIYCNFKGNINDKITKFTEIYVPCFYQYHVKCIIWMYNFFNQLSVLQLLGEHPVCS